MIWKPVNVRGEPTASVLSTDGFPLMAGSNFQLSDGNPIVISIFRHLADVLENVPETGKQPTLRSNYRQLATKA